MDKREEFLEKLREKYLFKNPQKNYLDSDPNFLEEELEKRNMKTHYGDGKKYKYNYEK